MKRQIGMFVVVTALLVGAMICAAYARPDAMGKMGEDKKDEMKCPLMAGGMGTMGDNMGMICGDMGMMCDHMGMMLKNKKMQKKLGLTNDQKAKLKKIFSDEQRKIIKTEADIKTLQLDLADLMEAPKSDKSKIDSKIDEIVAAHATMAKIKIHAMLDAKSVLTQEQMDKCMEMMEMGDKGMKGMNE